MVDFWLLGPSCQIEWVAGFLGCACRSIRLSLPQMGTTACCNLQCRCCPWLLRADGRRHAARSLLSVAEGGYCRRSPVVLGLKTPSHHPCHARFGRRR
ncbi:hypothetical protein ACLOJK_018984 [Asimina triloba]